jgi:hypothetical protein
MTKYIIDGSNGTILNMSDCYIIDSEHLGDDIIISDREAGELAIKHGISVAKMAHDTGFGDNAYRYTVSYSPQSVRDEADSLIEGGFYTEEDKEYKALLWIKDEATTEQLEILGDGAMSNESVWQEFRETLIQQVMFVYNSVKGDF